MSSTDMFAPWGLDFPDLESWSDEDYVWPPDMYCPDHYVDTNDTYPYSRYELNQARHQLLSSLLIPGHGRARSINTMIGIPQIIPRHVYKHVFHHKPYPPQIQPQPKRREPFRFEKREPSHRNGPYSNRNGIADATPTTSNYNRESSFMKQTDSIKVDNKLMCSANFHAWAHEFHQHGCNNTNFCEDTNNVDNDGEDFGTYRLFTMENPGIQNMERNSPYARGIRGNPVNIARMGGNPTRGIDSTTAFSNDISNMESDVYYQNNRNKLKGRYKSSNHKR